MRETGLRGDQRGGGAARGPIIVKKYANRRLYDTESSAYITLDDLAGLVRGNRDFVVYDARTGDDITRTVLTQIIMDEETRGRSILPTSFLRQLIGFYGDSLQGVVPEYLEQMMAHFAARHDGSSDAREDLLPESMRQGGRDDVAMLERAARVFGPVVAVRQAQEAERSIKPTREELQHEIGALKAEIERLKRVGAVPQAPLGAAPTGPR
jgi:polyhydroxyalkanoate synthesis repressor PhaR